eukprot:g1800.t1
MAQAEEIRTETGPLDYDYTEKEVELCQENLQNHKACSPDKIKNEMLKYGGTRITLSALQKEEEVVLLPGSCFHIKNMAEIGPKLWLVELKEETLPPAVQPVS